MKVSRRQALGLVLFAAIGLGGTACSSAPKGTPGERADQLAKRIQAAVNLEAWQKTAVVRWDFRGSHHWLWDRGQGLVRLVDDDGTVLIDSWDRGGEVRDTSGAVVTGAAATSRLQAAWSSFINDSFWLNPFGTFDNDGVSREVVTIDGAEGLVVRFASGGVTPGDTYVFFADAEGTPTRWKMWVQVLPVKGFETDFSDWVTLKSGARIAQNHQGPMGASINLAPVRGGDTVADVAVDGDLADDVFAPLLARRAGAAATSSTP